VLEPYLVTDDKKFIRLAADAEPEYRGRRLVMRSAPFFTERESRWSTSRLHKFLHRGRKVDPWQVFTALRKQIDRYLEFQESEVPDFIAVWIIASYLHCHFESFPYLQLFGPKSSGKTKTLTLIQATAFNAVLSSSVRPAGLFRLVDRSGATLLIDEAERLNNRESPELAQLLRAGYKRPSTAIRVQEKNLEPKLFNVFGPKAIANIRGLDDVLGSRCIVISTVRSLNRSTVNRNISTNSKRWTAIRAKLYALALDHSSAIRKTYIKTKRDEKSRELHGRNFELWISMFAVARFLEERGASKGLSQRLHALAKRKVEEHRGSSLNDLDTYFLLALSRVTFKKDIVTTKAVARRMATLLSEAQLSPPSLKWIGMAISRFGLGPGNKINGTYRYRISRKSVAELLKRYEVEAGGPTGERE
jgi:hypothetical protein